MERKFQEEREVGWGVRLIELNYQLLKDVLWHKSVLSVNNVLQKESYAEQYAQNVNNLTPVKLFHINMSETNQDHYDNRQ